MAWGPGMGGGMVGGGLGPPGGQVGNPGNGLPFAGIPSELQAGVDKLLKDEPEHGEPDVLFSYRKAGDESEHLTLGGLLFRHWHLGALIVLLITVVAVVNQAGPKLIDVGITDGMGRHRDMKTILVVGLLYLLSIAITAIAQRFQVMTTGRLAAWVLNDLRVKIFAHLQRLALDFYTEEKAGVIMTRMTSDIQNLQQLLQDGLSSLAVQGLTMLVITAILFSMNVKLALITILLIVPILTAVSLWFRSASEHGYNRVRDGIA
ncbi:MAG: ABC transporter transmembrane domain-containing protein, partial [Acidimicrobiales bacterium]